MTIYPAVYIRNGCAVKLRHGQFEDMIDYGDPVSAVLNWQEQGVECVQIIDLNGAFEGDGANLEAIRATARLADISLQLGGGIRSIEDMEVRLDDIGVDRVIIGTLATSDPDVVREACERWPERILLGLDVSGDSLLIRGWRKHIGMSADDLLRDMEQTGIDTLVFTDTARDSGLKGPNVEMTAKIMEVTNMKVIGSGGICSLADIKRLKEAGCEGVIIGRALYDGMIDLSEALAIA